MIRRPPRSTLSSSSAASDVYKRQGMERSSRFQRSTPTVLGNRPSFGNCHSFGRGPKPPAEGDCRPQTEHSRAFKNWGFQPRQTGTAGPRDNKVNHRTGFRF
eukprot:TRINITY_DN771_c0_g1_i3.p1 TRINITY_DN771_c0_g1~~TRINITY_DN771_c0_g1_i3.p1  ORF type:complete len:102 (+),score=4.58 TRINITY_DN771_c0_g1_i3:102-407(+)